MPNSSPNGFGKQVPAALKILYVMHVNWDWAKQRPHFIAEYLAKRHHVLVRFPFAINRSQLRKNSSRGLSKYPFLVLPYSDQYAFIDRMSTWINRFINSILIGWFRPDLIWLCSPEYLAVIPANHRARIVYDCMDDMVEFQMHPFKKKKIKRLEQCLVAEADLIFCSSGYLREKLIQRYTVNTVVKVLHNAFDPIPLAVEISEKRDDTPAGKRYKIGYIGTISNWLDCEVLFMLANTFEHIEIHLVGPIEIAKSDLIKHKRIFWHGPVPHDKIKYYAKDFDVLFMPFVINELTLSVDPVKFYEYIFFDKPIVSIKYPEIERFEAFVDFYVDYESLKGIICRYIAGGFKKKYSPEVREAFIAQNTWVQRVQDVEQSLGYLYSDHKNLDR